MGVVDFSKPFPGPAIDIDYFPNTQGDLYWTLSPYVVVDDADNAWAINFNYGYYTGDYKTESYYVRAVRFNH